MSDENYESIQDLYSKIEMLDERILKLEEIIVELANVDAGEEWVDWAEIAMEQRANQDRGEDR